MDGLVPLFGIEWEDQIEWWAQTWQFSSQTTCLFWVYNQSTPAWLALLLLVSDPEDIGSYALIGLAVLPCSPLPLVGFVFFCIVLACARYFQMASSEGKYKAFLYTIKDACSCRNFLICIASIPCLLFLMSNTSSSKAPFRFDIFLRSFSLETAVLRLLFFSLIEWLFYALVIGTRFNKSPVFWAACFSLFLAPMFRVGYNMDFSMRASIPGLTCLCVFCIKYILEAFMEKRHRFLAAVLIIALAIGAITPMLEFERGAYKVKIAGTNRLFSDPFKTVLHPDADTDNFICSDISSSAFYKYIARH